MSSNLDLNLLPSQARFQTYKLKFKKKVDFINKIILSFGLGLALVVMILWGWGKYSLILAEKKYDEAITDYSQLTEDVVTSQLLKYRAKIVGKALSERYGYAEAFETVYSLFPGMVVRDVSLVSKNLFKLVVEANDDSQMDEIEKRVIEINLTKMPKIKKINLTDVGVVNRKWEVGMEVELND